VASTRRERMAGTRLKPTFVSRTLAGSTPARSRIVFR
jgi:hypothetical protein